MLVLKGHIIGTENTSLMTQIELSLYYAISEKNATTKTFALKLNHSNVPNVQRPPFNTYQRSSHGYFPWELETTSLHATQHPWEYQRSHGYYTRNNVRIFERMLDQNISNEVIIMLRLFLYMQHM